MYSLVMMAALSGTPTAPEFNGYFRDLFSFRGGCNGCNGCNGCTGCGGGVFNGRILSFFTFNGGCCGGGSCYGSCTGRTAASCYGTSCNGGVVYAPPMALSCSGGMMMDSGAPYGYDAGTPYMQPYTPPYSQPYVQPPTTNPGSGVPYAVPAPAPPPSTEARFAPAGGDRATVVVRLPADARLFAEDRPLNLDSATRTFVTPPLPAGREYTYRFRAEYDRNGRTVSETKRMVVRPGGSVSVEFEDLTVARGPASEPALKTALAPAPVPVPMPAVGAGPAPAKITVTLPPGGTLYIDKQKDERPDRVREYTTPPLPPGKEFAYWMTVELGNKEYVSQKVVCKAGESVTADFTTKGQPDRRASAR